MHLPDICCVTSLPLKNVDFLFLLFLLAKQGRKMFSVNQFICLHCQLPIKIGKRQQKLKRKYLFFSVESTDIFSPLLLSKRLHQRLIYWRHDTHRQYPQSCEKVYEKSAMLQQIYHPISYSVSVTIFSGRSWPNGQSSPLSTDNI